jgi:hypothetical protein
MEAYSQTMVVDEIGLWLERALHVSNNCRGDSPKVAGCMDLLRVQGRWAPSARLAWLRCVSSASTDVSGGAQLSKSAPNTFPSPEYWDTWGAIFEEIWPSHINNIIIIINAPQKFDIKKKHTYNIDHDAVDQFEVAVVKHLQSDGSKGLRIEQWSLLKLRSFVHHTIRGFLHGDLYNAMTELLSRADGSFGLQAHCTLEPGVVVIASKGQPMSIAFDPARAIVLFASEAEALAVPVYQSGRWLPQRIDLDSHGEIVRVGEPRALQEGSFSGEIKRKQHKSSSSATASSVVKKKKTVNMQLPVYPPCISLDCGVEIRAYSLEACAEMSMDNLIDRCVTITSAPIPYDPKVDLVANDLKVTPAVLDAIDHGM